MPTEMYIFTSIIYSMANARCLFSFRNRKKKFYSGVFPFFYFLQIQEVRMPTLLFGFRSVLFLCFCFISQITYYCTLSVISGQEIIRSFTPVIHKPSPLYSNLLKSIDKKQTQTAQTRASRT